ncbi:MAG: hypothetical protein LAO04_03235 [Acidobacteriia bacterium]|nr:hypothetical protein [Terriglobia bacterium]
MDRRDSFPLDERTAEILRPPDKIGTPQDDSVGEKNRQSRGVRAVGSRQQVVGGMRQVGDVAFRLPAGEECTG